MTFENGNKFYTQEPEPSVYDETNNSYTVETPYINDEKKLKIRKNLDSLMVDTLF